LATRPPARESKVEHIDLDDTQGDWSGEE
jgi:hypothetical protein